MDALDKLNRDKKELMKTAEDILSFLGRELGRKSALRTQNMAFLAFLKKDFANAERLFIEAIEIDPEREDPYIMLTAFYNVIFSEARMIREDKLEILIELLYKKVEMNPTPLDRFIIGKLETQRDYFKKAHKQFMLSVKEDPSYYASVAGYIKTRLLTSPAEASAIIVEIDEYLAKDYPDYSKDELYFAKGVAYALEGDIKKGLAILENLNEKTKHSPPEGLAEAIGILSQ
jgi:tetratricopeptide (TPR) repeat protein